jgi:hypothetical protein
LNTTTGGINPSITVQTGKEPHEVEISRDFKKAAISAYGSDSPAVITIIDLTTLNKKNIETFSILIPGFSKPHGMEFINNELFYVTFEEQQKILLLNATRSSNFIIAEINTKSVHCHMIEVHSVFGTDDYGVCTDRTNGLIQPFRAHTGELIGEPIKTGKGTGNSGVQGLVNLKN